MARLGQLLVRAELVTENNLARALGIQNFAGGRLGTLLLERGSVDEDSLGKTLALQHGCEYIPWRILADVSLVVIAALPAKFAIKHAAVPYERGEGYLKLALRDPGDLRILDELFFVTGRKIIAGVAPEVRIYQALEKYYGERRTPRYAILAEKLSRPSRPARSAASLPPPPEFFPGPPRKAAPSPAPAEVWGEAVEPDTAQPAIIQSWKMPDQQIGGWAGTVSPGMDIVPPAEPETISWEEMPAPPSMWIPEPPESPESLSSPEPPPPLPLSSPPMQAEATAAAEQPRYPAPPERETPLRPPEPAVLETRVPEAAEAPAPPVEEVPPPVPHPAPAAAPQEPEAAEPPMPPMPPMPPPIGVPFMAELEAPSPVPAPSEPERPPVKSVTEAPPAPAPEEEPVAPRLVEIPPAPPLPPPPAAAPASMLAPPSVNDFPEVAAATDRDSIATAALMALGRRFQRGAVFVAKPAVVTAWGGAGNGVSPEELQDIAIPWTEPSVFLNVRLSRSFYLGPLPPLPRHEAIAIAMGGWPDECLVQPIMIKEKPVAFLYAEFTRDQGASPMDLAYMRELAGAASVAFVSAIRLKKKEI